MSTSNQSSRRQKKVPSWFSDHTIGENDIEIDKGVFGNGDNSQNRGGSSDSHKDVSDVPSDNTSNDL
ncbi:hypothetical protein Tco_1083805, partial [Tanacetum coccineum]